mgnify:CR=1 FL=1
MTYPEQFPIPHIIVSLFKDAYRGKQKCYANEPHEPCKNLSEMLERLEKEIAFQLSRPWLDEERKETLRLIVLDDAHEYMRWCAKEYKRVEVAVKGGPSIKQIALLRKLGVTVIPSKGWEASKMIDGLLKK